MILFVAPILFYCLATALGFVVFYNLGLPATVIPIVISLTASYFGIYLRNGLNSELAYWGLAYAGFSILILGIGLVQSHAGCQSLIGDCYQPKLPSGLFELKIIVGFFLICTNGLAILAIVRNMLILFSSSNNNHE
jgi:hypothetical protein